MAEPPSETGALQLIIAEATPAIPVTPKTDDGGLATGAVGVTEDDTEGEELPLAFVATTLTVMAVPLANPVSVADKTLPTVTAAPAEGVTVYPVIAEPFEAGAIHETLAEFVPATTKRPVGALGADIYLRVILKV